MAKKKPLPRGLVYSTDHGRMCPNCSRPLTNCQCDETRAKLTGDGTVRVRRETKGRGGKCVTVIDGVALATAELKTFAKELKKQCGSGGTVKQGNVEIQGDHRETVVRVLRAKGWSVKLAGG